MSREYLADEITMIQSDNQVLKHENDLFRMTNERKAEENHVLRMELDACKVALAEKIDEAAALRTILEGVGHNVSAGLNRFMERRALKQERHTQTAAAVAAPVVAAAQARERVLENQREEQSSEEHGHRAFAPPPKGYAAGGTVERDPPPAFLKQGPRVTAMDHPLLPRARSEEDILQDMSKTIESRRA